MYHLRHVASACALVVAIATLAVPAVGQAASVRAQGDENGKGPSPALRAMLREVDAGNVERSIRTLVGFGS